MDGEKLAELERMRRHWCSLSDASSEDAGGHPFLAFLARLGVCGIDDTLLLCAQLRSAFDHAETTLESSLTAGG